MTHDTIPNLNTFLCPWIIFYLFSLVERLKMNTIIEFPQMLRMEDIIKVWFPPQQKNKKVSYSKQSWVRILTKIRSSEVD